jgi:hypothetical protein
MVAMIRSLKFLRINSAIAAASLTIALSVSPRTPATADGTSQAANGSGASKPGVFNRMGKIVSKAPKAAASFVVGSLVGLPISAVRHSANEMKLAAKETVRGLKDPLTAPFFLVVGPEALVLGAMSGAVVGPYDAIETSAVNSFNKPFSKEAFSLGPMEKLQE